MPQTLDPATLAALDRIGEVALETTSRDGTRTHRTIVWIVTVGEAAYVRSVRGPVGRWYREIRRVPEATLEVSDTAIPVTAVPLTDRGTIQAVSEAFRAKYERQSRASTASMLQPHTLDTTLRLDPR